MTGFLLFLTEKNEEKQKIILRGLINVRPPKAAPSDFEAVQNKYLKEELKARGTVTTADMTPVGAGLYVWRGDITRIKCGAIVNAANSGMTGCYHPCHDCIDNCIHTWAGVQLRLECSRIIEEQGHPEETGTAKITGAYNLPCDYVIHTVGPIVEGPLTEEHCELLRSCYRACLETADKHNVREIAFCCISSGVFKFPGEKAAEIAVDTVKRYKAESGSNIEVIFNVYGERDEQIYMQLLG